MALICFVLTFNCFAQDTKVLSDGKAFAESIAPKKKGSVVDPSGVNPAAWTAGGTSTTIPSSAPDGLGAFSAPLTSSTLFGTSGASGALTGLGNRAIAKCQNYVPTGDKMLDQECAAVLFMNKDCMSLSAEQKKLVGGTNVQTNPGTNCRGTFGSDSSQFNFKDQITENDSIFVTSKNAQNNASDIIASTCNQQQAVTSPAEFATNLCSKSLLTELRTCTQDLSVSITKIFNPAICVYTCEGGILTGDYCTAITNFPVITSYSCPAGNVINGTQCIQTTTTAATGSYSCPPGEVLNGIQCIKTTTTAAGSSYSCPAGQVLSGNTCILTVTSTPSTFYSCPEGTLVNGTQCSITRTSAASASYTCPTGYALAGSSCSKSYTEPAELRYICNSGVLSGNTCVTTTTTPANVTYACSVGYLSGSSCVVTEIQPAQGVSVCNAGESFKNGVCYKSYTPLEAINCPTGYTPQGAWYSVVSHPDGSKYCAVQEWQAGWNCHCDQGGCSCSIPAKVTQSCPSGGFLEGGACQITTTAVIQYSCGQGALSGSSCIVTHTGPATAVYSCTTGSLQGLSTCVTTANGPAIPNYYCPVGQSLNGNQCTGTTVIPGDVTYSCPSGGILSGSNCITNTITSAILNYSCPAGQSISGSICSGNTINPATLYYYCPNGETLAGTSCISTAISPAILNYSCPVGQTLSGATCIGTTVNPADINYSCLPGQVLQGDVCVLTTITPATPNYSCPGGVAPVGDQCITYSTDVSWINGCTLFEKSAGEQLGTPK